MLGTEEHVLLEKGGEMIIKALKQSMNTKGYKNKGMNNTREAYNSLSYRVVGSKLIIEGLARILFLEFGRSPGGTSSGNTGENSFLGQIRSWVETRLGITDEKKRNQVAFLVLRKIKQKGTTIFTDRAAGLQIEFTLNELNNIIFDEVVTLEALNITNGLAKLWDQK